jgi:hypothetical protein
MLFSEAVTTNKSCCCRNGAIHTATMRARYAEYNNPPEAFKRLLADKKTGRRYREMSLSYNKLFSYCSTQCSNSPDMLKNTWQNFVKVNGELLHSVYGLSPPKDKDGNPCNPTYAQLYTVGDTAPQLLRRQYFGQLNALDKEIFDVLEEMMHANPISKTLLTAGELHKDHSLTAINVNLFFIL